LPQENLKELKVFQHETEASNRFAMNMVCKYDQVISRLPPLVKQNINAGAPPRFKWRLDTITSE